VVYDIEPDSEEDADYRDSGCTDTDEEEDDYPHEEGIYSEEEGGYNVDEDIYYSEDLEESEV
jgi:hypothetical protein